MSASTLGPRAFLKKLGLRFDKSPASLDRAFLNSFPEQDRRLVSDTWTDLKLGVASARNLYELPKTDRQTALLFSHDANRMVATMTWFQSLVALLRPASIVEVGCGGGYLLRFLHHAFPELDLTGIDRQSNLAELIPQNERVKVLAGDFLSMPATRKHDLVLCDFGWDNHDIPDSVSPHSSAEIAGQSYCPGCSNDLMPHYRKMTSAWKEWALPNASLACCGRLVGVGEIRALSLAAEAAGWHLAPSLTSTVKVRSPTGNLERFPALVFRTERQGCVESALEKVIDAYGNL